MIRKNCTFQKASLSIVYILFFISALVLLSPDVATARIDVRNSMVKIYCVQNKPDYDNPWNMKGPKSIRGSGCVIQGNRILTNAHVVSDQTYIRVRLHGQSNKYTARIIAVSHEADLALLTVDDPSFFKGIKPLKLGKLPEIEQEVVVYGFPKGGDTMSTTSGVVSRIEHQSYAHSSIELLAGQLDAAINSGNSGGPVIVGNRIVGVVMQTLEKSENIGYMVPAPIIKHFLIDMEDGRYDGFPEDGVFIQSLEKANLKKMYGLNIKQSGALVSSITPGSPADNKLFPGDVILSIDGHRVEDDGTVEFRPKERTRSDFYVQQHQVGEDVTFKILRNTKEKIVKFTLDKNFGSSMLVPRDQYDVRPTYYVYGGLVFCPLTLDYLMTWGDDWAKDSPYDLLTYWVDGQPSFQGEEIVIIIKVLPSKVNNGYNDFINKRITEVNGQKIRNLRHLVSIIEKGSEDSFVVLKTKQGQTISLDRKRVEEEHAEILETYRITADRSTDLQLASTTEETKGKKSVSAITQKGNKLQ